MLEIQAGHSAYPIFIEPDFSRLAEVFEHFRGVRACVVTDENVAALYLDDILKRLGGIFSALSVVTLTPGEKSKSLKTLSALYKVFVSSGMDRHSLVIALGGGVPGDVAGLAAATYMRGIHFAQIPTTLLSQSDSSTGGKTGINFLSLKNAVGAFYPPCFVYINTDTLTTLSDKEFSSGMAEVIKYGTVCDVQYFSSLEDNCENIRKKEAAALYQTVAGACRIKSRIVSKDEYDRGERMVLNFGHTFGHALESLKPMPHGYSVGIGILAASSISLKRGMLSSTEAARIRSILGYFRLPARIHADFTAYDVYERMLLDKKNKDGRLTLVLTSGIGSAAICDQVTKSEVIEALDDVLVRKSNSAQGR